jgi:Fur family ferric uptake transcriptional regulator
MVTEKAKKTSERQAKAAALLKSHNLKQTSPRLGLIGILMEEHGPFTIDDLHIKLKTITADVPDLATVYRTLTRFEELEIVNRCDFGDGTLRYELAHHDHHHHHIVCLSCRSVTPLAHCTIDLETVLPPDHGFARVSHKLEFFGICPQCTKKPS